MGKKESLTFFPRPAGSQLVVSLIVALLVTVLVAAVFHWKLLQPVDNLLYDAHFRLRGPIPVSGNILLVLMDDHSAIELEKKKGDWSRKDTARALDNLCRAGAEVIGIDLVMADHDPDPEADEQLARAIDECNNIVLPRVAATQHGGSRVAIEAFARGMIGEGFIDAQLDTDSVWRRMNYFSVSPLPDGSMQVIPCFSLEMVRTFGYMDIVFNEKDSSGVVLLAPDNSRIHLPWPDFLINYHGDFNAFDHISYSDVVLDRFDPERVKGKLVIIGSTLAVNKDTFLTPFSTFHQMPEQFRGMFKRLVHDTYSKMDYGVSVLANAAETILNDRIIHVLGPGWMFFLITAIGLISLVFYHPGISLLKGFFILIAILAAVVLARHIAFSSNDLVFSTAPLLAVVILQFVAGGSVQAVFAKKKAARISAMFGRYVSRGVADELVKGDIDTHLQGSQQNLTILFSDLRNFTAISEQLSPRQTRQLLNSYFGAMIPLVFKYSGTLDKLVGDMVMAFFGAPLPIPDHPVKAARSALAMTRALDHLRQSGKAAGMDMLRFGIGINTGPVVVGNLGSDDFIDYTVIGDAVNIANRLEGLNKVYGTQVIISESTCLGLGDEFLVRKLGSAKVKGKTESVVIFELRDAMAEATQTDMEIVNWFAKGLEAYDARDFETAVQAFSRVLNIMPDDGPATFYMSRIEALNRHPAVDSG